MQYFLPLTLLAALAAAAPAPEPQAGGTGPVIKASFTQYGSKDTWGSGTCNSNTVACGFYSATGYYAALSQNYFGVGPGAGKGPACGQCWRLTPQTDSSGKALHGARSIVVKVNNLCPAQGNPLCAQNGKAGTNSVGANANFDTCMDDGASAALFGSSGVGMAVGTAQMVDCNQWNGNGKRGLF